MNLLSCKQIRFTSMLLFVALLLLIPNTAGAQGRNSDYENYIRQYKDICIEQMKKHGIPASITMAQGLLESGAGKSELARKGNNHFGIKCHSDWTGGRTYHDDDERGECFRKYNSVRESFEDHSAFLKRRRYQELFTYRITDYKAWAHGLKKCGYATSPTYAQSLISIIERYELYKLDQSNNYDHFIAHHESSSSVYPIMINNGVYYVKAKEGDTYKTIGKLFGISYRKLAKYNECDKHRTLHEGEIVYLTKKARKAAKEFKGKHYTVKSGDSMHSISQKFGIRVKRLYKMNNMRVGDRIKVGDKIRLR